MRYDLALDNGRSDACNFQEPNFPTAHCYLRANIRDPSSLSIDTGLASYRILSILR